MFCTEHLHCFLQVFLTFTLLFLYFSPILLLFCLSIPPHSLVKMSAVFVENKTKTKQKHHKNSFVRQFLISSGNPASLDPARRNGPVQTHSPPPMSEAVERLSQGKAKLHPFRLWCWGSVDPETSWKASPASPGWPCTAEPPPPAQGPPLPALCCPSEEGERGEERGQRKAEIHEQSEEKWMDGLIDGLMD